MLKKTFTTLSAAALAATVVALPTAMAAPASPDTSVQIAACGPCKAKCGACKAKCGACKAKCGAKCKAKCGACGAKKKW